MEQLNIPFAARQGILKLPDAQKRAMVKQYEEQLKDEQKEESGKELSEELGLKRLSRIRGNGQHDLQILMIYKAIMDTDTSNKIKKDMIDDNQCISNIVAKVDSDDGKVRE